MLLQSQEQDPRAKEVGWCQHCGDRHQQLTLHRCGVGVKLRLGQEDLLNNATKGKLDHRWTGTYIVTGFKGFSAVIMWIGITVRKVHINLVHPLLTEEKRDQTKSTNWTPPCSTMMMVPWSSLLRSCWRCRMAPWELAQLLPFVQIENTLKKARVRV